MRRRPSFAKALKHHREPHSITLDGHQPSPSALRRMEMNGEFNFRGRNPVKIRCCQYLNNVVEQDHRRVKGRLRPMLGFKTFYNARRVMIGIELAQKIHKRQFAMPSTLQSNPAVTLASCHGSIVPIAGAHSWSYRSDNPICTRTVSIDYKTEIMLNRWGWF